jgi:hypothetical protein
LNSWRKYLSEWSGPSKGSLGQKIMTRHSTFVRACDRQHLLAVLACVFVLCSSSGLTAAFIRTRCPGGREQVGRTNLLRHICQSRTVDDALQLIILFNM